MDNEDTFADLLGYYRTQAGLTQDEFAREIKMSRNTIVKWENRISQPTRGQVLRLADELSLSKNELKALI